MALKATIYKADLQIADMDRHYYQTHSLTIARHPSETEQRMLLRLLVFAFHAHEDLRFTKGLSTDDEPDLWQKNPGDEITLWIELGQPDEKRIRKACGRAKQVIIYSYNTRSAEIWWRQLRDKCERFENLTVFHLLDSELGELGNLAARHMVLQCSIQEDSCWFGNQGMTIHIEPLPWKSLPTAKSGNPY